MMYKAKGVCAQAIEFEIDDNKKGMDAEEVISRLENIKCGSKPTSCPQQLAFALKEALA